MLMQKGQAMSDTDAHINFGAPAVLRKAPSAARPTALERSLCLAAQNFGSCSSMPDKPSSLVGL
jgi:hypothetical protein